MTRLFFKEFFSQDDTSVKASTSEDHAPFLLPRGPIGGWIPNPSTTTIGMTSSQKRTTPGDPVPALRLPVLLIPLIRVDRERSDFGMAGTSPTILLSLDDTPNWPPPPCTIVQCTVVSFSPNFRILPTCKVHATADA